METNRIQPSSGAASKDEQQFFQREKEKRKKRPETFGLVEKVTLAGAGSYVRFYIQNLVLGRQGKNWLPYFNSHCAAMC